MKLNNNGKKKAFEQFDDQVEEYDEPQKWYEQVRISFLFLRYKLNLKIDVLGSRRS